MKTSKESSSKVVDVLIENLKHSLDIVDRAFLLAILAAAFVVVHGLQGDLDRDFKEELERAAKAKSSGVQVESINKSSDRNIDIPVLGFKAELSTAIMVAIVCYWIFSIRAALHIWRIGPLLSRLGELDAEILAVAVLRPSLATAGLINRLLSCLLLGFFGWGAFVLSQLPYNAITGHSTSQTLVGALLMFIPAILLFVATELTSKRMQRTAGRA